MGGSGGGRKSKRKGNTSYMNPNSQGSGGGGGFNFDDDCANFSLNDRLQHVTDVLKTLHKGDILFIELMSGSVVAFDKNHEKCGNVIHPRIVKLIDCLSQGFSFVADVVYVSGFACDIHIRKAK